MTVQNTPATRCPSCKGTEVQVRAKRNALYPVGFVAIIGIPLAMLHKASSPHDCHCRSCAVDFAVRTTTAKIAYTSLFIVAGALCLLFVAAIYNLYSRS